MGPGPTDGAGMRMSACAGWLIVLIGLLIGVPGSWPVEGAEPRVTGHAQTGGPSALHEEPVATADSPRSGPPRMIMSWVPAYAETLQGQV